MGDFVEKIEGLTHFIVEYSEHDGQTNSWWKNQTCQVIAKDVYRVMSVFQEEHPDARVHVIRRLAPSAKVYIDRPVGPT